MSKRKSHFRRGRFHNPHLLEQRRSFWHVLLWQMGYYDDPGPLQDVPECFRYPNLSEEVDPSQPTVMWINHTTFLMTIDGVTILTDPVWSERVSPFRRLGPKRLIPPPLPLQDLPPIDYVLISHDHYDHLDYETVKQVAAYNPNATWCVPLGVAKWFAGKGIGPTIELDWWESIDIAPKRVGHPLIELYAVPSQHYSGRTLFDRNKTLWAGWVVKCHSENLGEKKIYFVGDTGYNEHDFKEIGQEFGSFDLSLVPIGAYLPEDFMRTVHVSPRDAVNIHVDSGSKLSVGGHWGTFQLASEAYHQPPYDLFNCMKERGLSHETFRILDHGQAINW